MSKATLAAIPFPAGRVENQPWEARASCSQCGDTGQLSFGEGDRSSSEQMAPCKHCNRGFMLEFAYGRKRSALTGKAEFYQGRLYWGPDGFWHSHTAHGVAPKPTPLSKTESDRRKRVLARAMRHGGLTRVLLDELYDGDQWGRAEHERLIPEDAS